MIKILIADDHVLVREGLKKILKIEADMMVVGEATNGHEVFEQLRVVKPDIVLLDISMPGPSGLEVLEEIKRDHPKIPVLILSMHPEDRFAVRAFKMGASGYITKGSAVDELVGAIHQIVGGRKYVSPKLAEMLAGELESDHHLLHEALSNREFQIMCLIAAGKRNSAIAQELSLSPSTVNTYRARILGKMKMQSNAELTRYAAEHKLIE